MYKFLLKEPNGIPVSILNTITNTVIPIDDSNHDYKLYLKWLEGYEFIDGEFVKTSDSNVTLPA